MAPSARNKEGRDEGGALCAAIVDAKKGELQAGYTPLRHQQPCPQLERHRFAYFLSCEHQNALQLQDIPIGSERLEVQNESQLYHERL